MVPPFSGDFRVRFSLLRAWRKEVFVGSDEEVPAGVT